MRERDRQREKKKELQIEKEGEEEKKIREWVQAGYRIYGLAGYRIYGLAGYPACMLFNLFMIHFNLNNYINCILLRHTDKYSDKYWNGYRISSSSEKKKPVPIRFPRFNSSSKIYFKYHRTFRTFSFQELVKAFDIAHYLSL